VQVNLPEILQSFFGNWFHKTLAIQSGNLDCDNGVNSSFNHRMCVIYYITVTLCSAFCQQRMHCLRLFAYFGTIVNTYNSYTYNRYTYISYTNNSYTNNS